MTPEPWRVLSSEIVLADRWIRVRADRCIGAEGQEISPYYVLEYGDWVSVFALDLNGDAIVVEEYRHGAEIVALGTVGGGIEPGESAVEAAARELREETGFAADELIDLGSTWANFGNQPNRVHHFLALDCQRVGEQSLDESESIAVHILPVDGLDGLLHQSHHQLTWFKSREWLRR